MKTAKIRRPGIATRTKRIAFVLALCVLTGLAGSAQPQGGGRSVHRAPDSPLVKDASFHSVSLEREMRYRIYLPHNYPAITRRYPVLYLLHGLYGDYKNWDTRTNLAKYIARMD